MPTRLLLEGEDLPALMARIRAEMGPGARIVKAEKVRTGGVAGFFAKEHYELTIEVSDVAPAAAAGARAPRPPAGPAAPVGMDALLAAADEAEVRAADDGAAATGGRTAASPGAATGPTGGAGPVDPGDPLAEGGDAQPAPGPPSMSTATPGFAEVLASMRQMVDGPAPALPAVGHGTSDGEAAGTGSGEGDAAGVPGAGTAAGAAGTPGAGPVAPGAATPSSAEVVDQVPAGATPVEAREVTPPRPHGSGSSATELLELGVPARLLSGVQDPNAPVPLSVLVRRFEKPPTLRLLPGGVVAVVGPAALALRTAQQMAQRADVDPHDVVLAGAMPAVAGHGRRLTTPGALARLRARVPEDVPTVVALGAPMERSEWALAAELLDALTPHQAWGVVDARSKGVELRRWMRGVGTRRPFDALAVCHTFEAQAPGTVLGLGTPVGWVDGLPASPVVWAAVLSERLTDDARWD